MRGRDKERRQRLCVWPAILFTVLRALCPCVACVSGYRPRLQNVVVSQGQVAVQFSHPDRAVVARRQYNRALIGRSRVNMSFG